VTGYAVVIEGEEGSYSAWSPELPGCVATGGTLDGAAIPPPSAVATTVIPMPAA
jgi:hypothetical protein